MLMEDVLTGHELSSQSFNPGGSSPRKQKACIRGRCIHLKNGIQSGARP